MRTLQDTIEAFDEFSKIARQRIKKQMEELIGQVVTTEEGKKYLAISMRHIGDKYLYHFITVDKPLEMIVGEVQCKDDKFSMRKYTGNDYDKTLKEFMNNALNDLQAIKTRLHEGKCIN